ncbi:hypothetical protein Ndes2437A_g07815 [Nannochloris sp. 'desiccata']
MSAFRDVAQLINGPEYPNSVQWADDGTLAVAEGSCVGILHPGSLSGAQAFAAVDGFAQNTVIAAPGKPNGACIHFDMALSLRVLLSPVKESASGGGKGSKESGATTSRRPLASAKAIAWSPTGAATAGGCLLATVTNDHRVIIFGPDKKLDPEWRPVFTVHEHLLNYLTETRWEAIDAVTLREHSAMVLGNVRSSNNRGGGGGGGGEEDDNEDDEEMLRLRGGAGEFSDLDGEESLKGDEEPEEKKQDAKKSSAAAAAKGVTSTKSGKAPQKQTTAARVSAPAPLAPTNRRKPVAPQLAPAGDATDLGGVGPSSTSAGADAALAAQAVLAGIPPVDFQQNRLAKLAIADTVAKRFFELRRQHEPASLPTYDKTSTHLKDADKDNLEKASEEYFKVYGEKIAELGLDKKKFWQECRIALPRCWNRKRNVFIKGFEESIGGGFGPGGEIQVESDKEADSEATDGEEEAGEEAAAAGGRMRKLRRKRQAAAAAMRDFSADEGVEKQPQQPGSKRKRAIAVNDPVFEREVFEFPSFEGEGSFTWRDLPPVDNSNRTALKITLIEGAVKRFLRLRAAEPASLLPSYPSQKSFLKGVDAWNVDRVMKEYMREHAPAMASLQFDLKKFTGFFNARLRQVWDRSSSDASDAALLEPNYDIHSDNGLLHPEGSGEGCLLGPIPVLDKVDPNWQRRSNSKPSAGAGEAKTVGGAIGNLSTNAAGASSSGAAFVARGGEAKTAANKNKQQRAGGKARFGGGYNRDSLGGTQWWGGSDLNSDVYERRLLSICAISVAWSPAVAVHGAGNNTNREEMCSYLAMGTKEGSIWLWRCRHPAVPALPGTVEEESARLEERMELVGKLPGNLSWADTMKWVTIPVDQNSSSAAGGGGTRAGAVVILVVGTSDGAVTLWGNDSSTLNSFSTATSSEQQHLPLLMEKWNTLLQPDLTQVISMDAALRYTTTSTSSGIDRSTKSLVGAQLVVAIGKSAGVVSAWTSSDLSISVENVKTVLQQRGYVLKIPEPSGLGSSSVTGVGLAAGGEIIVACTREGALESWSLPLRINSNATNTASSSGRRVSGNRAVLQPRSAPVACSVRKQKEGGFGSFGVAISPGGMFVAVPKNALPAGTDYVKQLQVWQRLTLGLLHLHRIAGPGAEVDGFAAATLICKNWAARRLPPAAIWDAVTLARMQEGLASAVAESLETDFLEMKQSVLNTSTTTTGKGLERLLPSDISDYGWRLMRAAVTLRRAEAAAAVAAAAKTETLEIPHQDVLDRNQMYLLQRQLEKLLSTSKTGDDAVLQQRRQLRQLLAADCVVANAKHKDLMLGLLPLAVKAYHEAGETPPGEANAFAIPSRDGGALLDHRPVAMAGGSAAAALTTMFHEEGQAVVLHRCPATLEVSLGAGKWVCRGCQRAYNEVPTLLLKQESEQETNGDYKNNRMAPPECVMCSGLLGPYCPDFLLIPPCI